MSLTAPEQTDALAAAHQVGLDLCGERIIAFCAAVLREASWHHGRPGADPYLTSYAVAERLVPEPGACRDLCLDCLSICEYAPDPTPELAQTIITELAVRLARPAIAN